MLLYILIFGLAVIGSVLLLWYFDPLERETFQVAARLMPVTTAYTTPMVTRTEAAAAAARPPPQAARFWELVVYIREWHKLYEKYTTQFTQQAGKIWMHDV